MKTKILHVRMSFAIELAEAIDARPASLSPGQALAALDGAALAVANLLPSHLRTDPQSVTICEGADVHIGLDKPGETAHVERTREVVLRAMLAAYEAYVVRKETAMLRDADMAAKAGWEAALGDLAHVRRAVVLLPIFGEVRLFDSALADYEARLRGDRPLDAPPAEVL